ncbi:MAG: PCRF domain-containing protein [Phycisphaerales bacterium]
MGETRAISGALRARLEEIASRYDALTARLESPEVASDFRQARETSMQRAALAPAASAYKRLCALEREREELVAAERGEDAELAAMAREEAPRVEEEIGRVSREAMQRLVSSDDDAIGSVMVEVRAGVGGDEAMLWAGELVAMYQKRAARKGWEAEVMDLSEGGGVAGGAGIRSAVLNVRGAGVWTEMSHEGGTHCVKRVPATEAQGRIHTSTATVAVLPEPEEVELDIDPEDVREDITTAQGPGGQNVNKVATAVKLLHVPTGIEVRMQESKSQRQNREKAWRLLRARLYELELAKKKAERDKARSAQIGGGDRSERVRTYRFKEGIAVDHRLEQSFNLDRVMAGEADDLHAGLVEGEVERRLAAL